MIFAGPHCSLPPRVIPTYAISCHLPRLAVFILAVPVDLSGFPRSPVREFTGPQYKDNNETGAPTTFGNALSGPKPRKQWQSSGTISSRGHKMGLNP